MPPGKPCRPDADTQASQDQAKASRLEAQLRGRGGNRWANERYGDRYHPKPDLQTMGKQRTPDAGQPPFEGIVITLCLVHGRVRRPSPSRANPTSERNLPYSEFSATFSDGSTMLPPAFSA